MSTPAKAIREVCKFVTSYRPFSFRIHGAKQLKTAKHWNGVSIALANLLNLSDQMYWCSLCPLRIRWLELLRIQTEPLTTVTNSRMPWCGISESCGAEIRITNASNHNCNKLFIDRKSNPRKSKPLLQKIANLIFRQFRNSVTKFWIRHFGGANVHSLTYSKKNSQGCLEKN